MLISLLMRNLISVARCLFAVEIVMAKIVGDLRVCKEPYFRKTEFEWKVNEFSKLKPAEAPGVARSSLLEPRLSVQSPIFKYGGQDCQLTLCTSPSRAAVGFICVKEPRFTYPCKVEIGARKVVTHELGSTIELRDLSREKSFDRKDISAGDKDELLIRCTIESWADAVSRDSIRHKLRVCDRLDELLESSDLRSASPRVGVALEFPSDVGFAAM